MWIFGYGSLMDDRWEEKFGCLRRCIAVLHGYGRTFNKASTSNWGSKETPCPTLNLEKIETGLCTGIAFEFPDTREAAVREYLADREGKGFPLEGMTVRLEDATEVQAFAPVYRGKNLLTTDKMQQMAVMINRATGRNGSCRDYVKQVAELLAKLGIEDPAVSELWQAVQEESLKSIMVEICSRLEILESNLPRRVDGFAVSSHTKIPFKALVYREALIWRMAELGRAAFESFEEDKLASAILLTRAAVETSAALWYLCAKLDATVQSGAVGDIDDYLMKLMLGSKTNLDIMPQAINVLTFVDRVDKDIEGFRRQYDALSEFAHPNWAGTALLYSKPNAARLWTDFGANIRAGESTKSVGVLNLSVALAMFERSYNRIGEIVPAFVTLCESRLKTEQKDKTMPPKRIIALATHHHVQLKGHGLNDRFGQVISLIRENYPIQIILEEWMPDRQSFASTVDTDKLKWKNVGTPKEKRFETHAYGLNTDPPTHDPKKPMLQEYGPLDVHELRERYMVDRIKESMEPFNVGLFIVGLAHLHSTLSKLKTAGFEVRGYSWMEQ